ncbi:hypothetical protein [Gordonibacter sp.]|uniref:hypothetical protein n=1 Tax=Gordonibacter sp. TaxID=1968902 RepID=UPI002FC97365
MKVLLRSSEGAEWEEEIVAFNGVENETGEIRVATGSVVGTYSWPAEYRSAGKNGSGHAAVYSTVSIEYRPHAVSLAVRDAAKPVVTATVNIGAACAVGLNCGSSCLAAAVLFSL